MTNRAKSLVLVSGGPDSAVALAWALRRGPAATLDVDYPGRPRKERRAVDQLLRHYDVGEHYRAQLPAEHPTPKVGPSPGSGYIPGRNLAFHALALAAARRAKARWVVAGHLGTDGEEFVDAGRPFFDALEDLGNRFRQRREPAVLILTPLASMTKGDAWSLGQDWGVPFEKTWSCYQDGPVECGRCQGCRERHDAERHVTRTTRQRSARKRMPT